MSNKSSIFISETIGIALLKHKQGKSFEVNYLHGNLFFFNFYDVGLFQTILTQFIRSNDYL